MAAETQTLKHEKHLRILAIAARILMQVYKVLYVLKVLPRHAYPIDF